MTKNTDHTAAVVLLALLVPTLALITLNSSVFLTLAKQALPFADLWLGVALAMGTGLAAAWLPGRTAPAWRLPSWGRWLAAAALAAFIAAVFRAFAMGGAFTFYYADYANGGPGRRNVYTAPGTWACSLVLCAVLVTAAYHAARRGSRPEHGAWRGAAGLLATAFVLAMSQYNLLVAPSPYAENTINLGVVLMPIVNLFNGALLPLDAQSQYGLYAYFLLPFLKLTGLGPFTLSLAFTVLFFACFMAVYTYTARVTSNAALALAVLVAAFFLNTSFGNVWPGELYYQYRPIRMLAPCTALALFLWHRSQPGAARRRTSLAVLSALVVWNSDSGIPTVAAFAVANAFDTLFADTSPAPRRLARFVGLCLEWALILVAVFGLFTLMLFLIDGRWMTPALFFEPLRIWRKAAGFFSGWAQPAAPLVLVYTAGIVLALCRGVQGTWQQREAALLMTGLTGIGIATYGTQNPQAAALTAYLLPVMLAQLATQAWAYRPAGGRQAAAGCLFAAMAVLPVAWLATSWVLHLKTNSSYINGATLSEIVWPDKDNAKGLWAIPGNTPQETGHVRVADLASATPPRPDWQNKADWLRSLPYLAPSTGARVLIASVHDHYLYAALDRATPVRLVNFVHIPIYSNWPLMFEAVEAGTLDYIVIDRTYLLRNTDAQGPASFDRFEALVDANYQRVDEKAIGADWHYPGWKASVVTVYRRTARP